MEKNVTRLINGCFLFMILLVVMLVAGEAGAEGLQARYLENSGTRSVLEITIENPAPSSVIVMQQIPRGLRPQNVSPPYSKYSSGSNEVKWLFKEPSPGIIRISLQLSAQLPAKGLSAVIRCKSPVDGTLMTIRVQ